MIAAGPSRILIVDDDKISQSILLSLLQAQGHEVALAGNGQEALKLAASYSPDLMLLDVMMPGLDGFEVCRRLRTDPHTAELPVIMITALDDREARLQARSVGVDEFLTKPIDTLELQTRVNTITRVNRYRRLLDERRYAAELAQHTAELLQQQTRALEAAYDTTLEGWARALDLRDKETEGHSRRVTELAVRLAHTLGLYGESIVNIRRGALLHDIGKLGVPDAILHKTGPLTDEEWVIMRRHTTYAYELLSPIAYLEKALDIPYYHHERWDGSGYPHGLRGEQIPLAARIFALADVWDALTNDRMYRPAWPAARARDYIDKQAGIHFDPALVQVFLRMIDNDTASPEYSGLHRETNG